MSKRAKLYELNIKTEQWVDRGTGSVECKYYSDKPTLVIKSEKDNKSLLWKVSVSADEIFQKKLDTYIIWCETVGSTDMDFALSFQDPAGCNEIWEDISDIQRSLSGANEYDLDNLLKGDLSLDEIISRSLPHPTTSSIDRVQTMIHDTVTGTTKQKETLAKSVCQEDYIRKLVDLWKTVEGRKIYHPKFYNIFKDLILLNHMPLVQTMLSSFYVYDIMSALEYDPSSNGEKSLNHSDFLKNQAQFKEVVPIYDISLKEMIHETYRLQYLKDVVLASVIDEATYSSINGLVLSNNSIISSQISSNEKLINSIFTSMRSPNMMDDKLKDQLSFFSELCTLARNLEMKYKGQFYQTLARQGMFSVLEKTLTNFDSKIRLLTAELLLNTVENDPGLLRNYILNSSDSNMFKMIVTRIDSDHETGVKNLLTDVVRHLCNVSLMEDNYEKTTFLTLLYQKFVTLLFGPLSRPIPQKGIHKEPEALLKSNLCELMGYFVQNHVPHVCTNLLNKPIPKLPLNLLKSKEKFLNLAAIRYVRSFLEVDNNHYHNYVVGENMLEPVVQLYVKNKGKYNLLDSAILDLFESITKVSVMMVVVMVMVIV
eukprot:TRINITY_DN2076_c0_g1_i3.p1 TRINITY_DN2076_c0_g1~~TRINITY_DN2076_c0_g1_i3.p1  ORF type:complete len:597 (-),score=95.52 TRINITY_DN2076_c0_g1_i3:213-2003(-)